MKYKKHIATGALAISLLVGGSSVFAATPQDLGIKNVQQTYQRQQKNNKHLKDKNRERDNVVGSVSAVNASGFTLELKNMRTKVTSSVDVKTDANTVYKKNGLDASSFDLVVGQKVIVVGALDKTTNILTAKIVKMVNQTGFGNRNKK
ncbi:hypothetical protein IT399_01425 [Candidatus Nomurabacteria bacterium]|nr:hypothetical protein [Candidatus Nomurabacteria bacterium]